MNKQSLLFFMKIFHYAEYDEKKTYLHGRINEALNLLSYLNMATVSPVLGHIHSINLQRKP